VIQLLQHLIRIALTALLLQTSVGNAQNVPAHAQGLKEELISVDLSGSKKQVGVYSTKSGVDKPTKLAVLLPGSPSVVRPIVENGVMTNSRLTGNFLIRARRFLVDESVASLIVDCQSESGDDCSSGYQASKQRQEDVDKLIDEVKSRNPSIAEVWLVGTSKGTISSSFMVIYNPTGYAGAIHTASITDPYARGSYRELGGFDYKKASIPQFFVHHANDPCALTTYPSAKSIAEKYLVPLITVTGGSGFQGGACEAFTEHGFRGKEKEVMNAMTAIIKSGKATQLEIN
jgi:alpha/beta superfamily hydrolase